MTNLKEGVLVNLLVEVKRVLDDSDIEFWLDCGTLLGAVRDRKFIPWEHDIDLGAWQDKVSDVMKTVASRELCIRGYCVNVFEDYININVEGEKCHADINFYRLTNSGKAIMPRSGPISLKDRVLYYSAMLLSNPQKPELDPKKTISFAKKLTKVMLFNITHVLPTWLRKPVAQMAMIFYKKFGEKDVSWVIPSNYFTNLSTMKFYGLEFKIPSETEEYLAYRYGKDWKTPRMNWRTERDDGTVGKFFYSEQ